MSPEEISQAAAQVRRDIALHDRTKPPVAQTVCLVCGGPVRIVWGRRARRYRYVCTHHGHVRETARSTA